MNELLQGMDPQSQKALYEKKRQQEHDEKVFAVRHLRQEMHRLMKDIKEEMPSTRSTSIAYTSVEVARMWLGKVLHVFGEAYPYPGSMNPGNTKIEPAADVPEEVTSLIPADLHGKGIESQIAILKFLRLTITNMTNQIFQFSTTIAGFEASFAYQHICEANMWLGVRLGELRDA